MKIALSDIYPNPHRDLTRNKINQEQVAGISASIERTGFWDNVVVRKHPTKKGTYQLAYGHNRVAAMGCPNMEYSGATVSAGSPDFIVKPLTDYDMLAAMIDENNTQQHISPAVVLENAEATIALAEDMLNACDTVEEFNKNAKTSMCASQHTSPFSRQQFSQAKNCIESGEGLGRGFLDHFLPDKGSINPHVLQAAIDAHYADSRKAKAEADAAAEDAEAEALEAEAEAAEAEAEANAQNTQTVQRATKRATKSKAKAKVKRQAAIKSKAKAEKVESAGVERDLLEMLPTPTHVAQVTGIIKANKIPKKDHKDFVEACIAGDWSTNTTSGNPNTVAVKGNDWWFVRSGKATKQRERAKVEQLKWKHREKTVDEFSTEVGTRARKLTKEILAIVNYADQIENKRLRGSLAKAMLDLEEAANELGGSLQTVTDGSFTPDLKRLT